GDGRRGSPTRVKQEAPEREPGLQLEVDEAPPPVTGLSAATAACLGATKRALIGRPRATRELEETLLPKWLALPIFSSDPLSSVAYATEAALAVLIAASASSAHLVFPLTLATIALLAVVVLSYA